MKKDLTFYQTRLLGCLIEKEITTPEQYPLSLNSLMLACNQKSNREPVLDLEEVTIQVTMDELIKRGLAIEANAPGARTIKYRHLFCNTMFGSLKLSAQELAIICVLFLRGAQTPGELRTRTSRLAQFASVEEVEHVLQGLQTHSEGPLVTKLEREPGKRESRYQHLFSGDDFIQPTSSVSESAQVDTDRLQALEARVDELTEQVNQLRQQLESLLN